MNPLEHVYDPGGARPLGGARARRYLGGRTAPQKPARIRVHGPRSCRHLPPQREIVPGGRTPAGGGQIHTNSHEFACVVSKFTCVVSEFTCVVSEFTCAASEFTCAVSEFAAPFSYGVLWGGFGPRRIRVYVRTLSWIEMDSANHVITMVGGLSRL
eukprot:1196196-Prorocentrum_minimum.AAC.9